MNNGESNFASNTLFLHRNLVCLVNGTITYVKEVLRAVPLKADETY